MARDLIDEEMIVVHSDPFFSRKLAHDILNSAEKNIAAVGFTKTQSEKDFKGRVRDGKILSNIIYGG